MVKHFKTYWQLLRLNDTWQYKAPVLMSVVYLTIAITRLDFPRTLFYLFLSYITLIGIAGFAYSLNDWGDLKADKLAGKPNFMEPLSGWVRMSLVLAFLLLALIPWYWFPFTRITLTLLALELLLFAAYSLPVIRLKERPFAGAIADALYAHLLPAVLACVTFLLIAGQKPKVFIVFLLVLSCWQFCLGMRNMLYHLLADADNDRASGIRTFATVYAFSETPIKGFVIVEALAFLLLLIISGVKYILPEISIIPVLYLFNFLLVRKETSGLKRKTDIYVDNFYYLWLPIGLLMILCLQDIRFLVVLFIHILLFRAHFSKLLSRW